MRPAGVTSSHSCWQMTGSSVRSTTATVTSPTITTKLAFFPHAFCRVLAACSDGGCGLLWQDDGYVVVRSRDEALGHPVHWRFDPHFAFLRSRDLLTQMGLPTDLVILT
jgi:hypothetical protein